MVPLNLSTMITLYQLRLCLPSLLQRNDVLDKDIGDDSPISTLHERYYLVQVNKAYLNRHLPK